MLLALVALFTLTILVSNWYRHERLARARRYYARGAELARRGNAAQAVEQYRNALAISRENPEYQLAVAQGLIEQRKWGEAAVYLQEVLEEDPSEALPNLLLARIASARGRTDQAVTYYNRAIYGRWQDGSTQHRVDARLELIRLLAQTGGRKQVIAELLQMAEQDPTPQVQRTAAGMLLEQGAYSQAAEMYRELLRNGERGGDVYAGLGKAELAQGDYRGARRNLSRALRENPHDASVRGGLNLAEDVLELDPSTAGLREAARRGRSRALLDKILAGAEKCVPEDQLLPTRRLLSQRRAQEDELLSEAGRIWALREKACPTPAGRPDALALVMARLAAQ